MPIRAGQLDFDYPPKYSNTYTYTHVRTHHTQVPTEQGDLMNEVSKNSFLRQGPNQYQMFPSAHHHCHHPQEKKGKI